MNLMSGKYTLQWAINPRTPRLLWVMHVSAEAQGPLPKLCHLSHPPTHVLTQGSGGKMSHEVIIDFFLLFACVLRAHACMPEHMCGGQRTGTTPWTQFSLITLNKFWGLCSGYQACGAKCLYPPSHLTGRSWNAIYPYCVNTWSLPPLSPSASVPEARIRWTQMPGSRTMHLICFSKNSLLTHSTNSIAPEWLTTCGLINKDLGLLQMRANGDN